MAEDKRKDDKRKSAWVLTEQAATDIRECFQNETSAYRDCDVNAKTGKKILSRAPVKKDKLKDFVTDFLDFLDDYSTGKKKHDGARHHDKDIQKAIQKYVPNGKQVDWQVLAEKIQDTSKPK